jgi:hypothetical protein
MEARTTQVKASPSVTFLPPTKKRKPEGLRRFFTLYIQNIKSGGGKRTFSQLYISARMNDLEKNSPI